MKKNSLTLKSVAGITAAASLSAAAPAGAPLTPDDEEQRVMDKVFAAEVDIVCANAQGTPGQEAANFITQPGWVQDALLTLKGDKAATAAERAKARGIVRELAATAAKGPGWPKPAAVRAPYTAVAPLMDGKLDAPAWAAAATFEGAYLFGEKEKTLEPKTVWRVMWDDQFLYFAFDCADADIQTPNLKRGDLVFHKDCVEMFFLSDAATATYLELVVNPVGTVFGAVHRKKLTGWGPAASQIAKNVEGLNIGSQMQGAPNRPGEGKGFTIEVALPFRRLPGWAGKTPAAGQTLQFTLIRLDWNHTGEMKGYGFQPLLSWGHNIWNYAPLELVGK